MHDTSTPNRSETNGVVERANRRAQNGASTSIVQSGFMPHWWPDAIQCYCFNHQIEDAVGPLTPETVPPALPPDVPHVAAPAASVEKPLKSVTAYENRFGKPFDTARIPFGAAVEYKPTSIEGRAQLPKMGSKLLKGIFMGYKTHSGGRYSGELLIADAGDLEAASFASEITIRSIQEPQVAVCVPFSFPLVDATQLQPPHEVDKWSKPIRV